MNSDIPNLPSKRLLKEFASLDDSKGRRRTGMFVAEGTKCISELLVRFECEYLYCTKEWSEEHVGKFVANNIVVVPKAVLRELTRLQATPPVVAFFRLPEASEAPDTSYIAENLTLALDRVQDPGNMGTILRCCDWMGVRRVVASHDCVDAFNPKAVQASMGALARVEVSYVSLPEYLASLGEVDVYGTFLGGENIYTASLSRGGLLIMGNEGQGISSEVARYVSRRLLIPSWPPEAEAVESLNVGVATAIALSQFRARIF